MDRIHATSEWPSRWALAVAVVAAGVTASFVLRIVVGILLEPTIAQELLEANQFFGSEALRNGGGLAAVYPATWSEHPLIVTPYPPVFHLLWAAVAWLLGGESSYLPGRIVATLALAGCVVLIYGIARQLEASRLAAFAFALVFLTPVPVAKWAGIARVDIPGLAFTLLGLYMYLRLRERPGHQVLWSAVPFVIAGLTKQSFIAAPAAVILAELLGRRWKRGVLLAFAVGGPVLLFFGFLDLLTGGGFTTATFGSLTKQVFYRVGLGVTGDFVLTFPVPGVLLFLALAPIAVRRSPDTLALTYLCTSILVLMLTIGKPGANVNYFIEPMAALCIAAAAGFATLERGTRLRQLAAAALAVSLFWLSLDAVPDYQAAFRQHDAWRQDHRPGIQLPAAALSGGPVLAPPSTYTLLPEPRPIYYLNDDYTFSVMAARDKFPRERIIDDLRQQRIAAVIAYQTVFTNPRPAFIGDWQGGWTIWSVQGYRDALFESYVPVDVRLPKGLVLFLPKSAEAGSAASAGPAAEGSTGER